MNLLELANSYGLTGSEQGPAPFLPTPEAPDSPNLTYGQLLAPNRVPSLDPRSESLIPARLAALDTAAADLGLDTLAYQATLGVIGSLPPARAHDPAAVADALFTEATISHSTLTNRADAHLARVTQENPDNPVIQAAAREARFLTDFIPARLRSLGFFLTQEGNQNGIQAYLDSLIQASQTEIPSSTSVPSTLDSSPAVPLSPRPSLRDRAAAAAGALSHFSRDVLTEAEAAARGLATATRETAARFQRTPPPATAIPDLPPTETPAAPTGLMGQLRRTSASLQEEEQPPSLRERFRGWLASLRPQPPADDLLPPHVEEPESPAETDLTNLRNWLGSAQEWFSTHSGRLGDWLTSDRAKAALSGGKIGLLVGSSFFINPALGAALGMGFYGYDAAKKLHRLLNQKGARNLMEAGHALTQAAAENWQFLWGGDTPEDRQARKVGIILGVGMVAAPTLIAKALPADELLQPVVGKTAESAVRAIAATALMRLVIQEGIKYAERRGVANPKDWMDQTLRAASITTEVTAAALMSWHIGEFAVGLFSHLRDTLPTSAPPTPPAESTPTPAEAAATATLTATPEPSSTPTPLPTETGPAATPPPTEDASPTSSETWQLGHVPTLEQLAQAEEVDRYTTSGGEERILVDLDGQPGPDAITAPDGTLLLYHDEVAGKEVWVGSDQTYLYENPNKDFANGFEQAFIRDEYLADPNQAVPVAINTDNDTFWELRRSGPDWYADLNNDGSIDATAGSPDTVTVNNLVRDDTTGLWQADSVTSQADSQTYTVNSETGQWTAAESPATVQETAPDSTTTTEDSASAQTSSAQSTPTHTQDEIQAMLAQDDDHGRPIYYLSNHGPVELAYGPEGGPIGMAQELFALGHPSWTGNDVGQAGQEWGMNLVDLVQRHAGVSPVAFPGDTIESLLDRYDIPDDAAAAFLADLHAEAGN